MRLNNALKIGMVCFAFALALHDGAWAQIPEHDITVGRTINVPGPSGLVYRDDGFWVISWSIGEGTRLHHYSFIGVLLGNYSVPEEYLVQGLAWDGKYWWIADNIHPSGDKIKKCELTRTGLNVLKEYIWPGPGSGPVALEWAQGYLWVVDNHTDVIYRTTVNDTSFTSVEPWSSGNISPYGLAWDGTNMWSSCSPAGGGTSGPREIYKHDANGNIIEIWHYPGADGPPPGAYGGCATDIAFVGNRLWYCDYDKNQIIEAIRGPGENWQIVYQTDFSSDPGWITSWPDRYVWDPATGTYCFSHIMYTYSYVPIAYDPTLKYKLEFDINLTQCEWGSYFNLGLWDADMLTKGPTHWHVRYHHVDEGNSACIVYCTNDLSGGGDSPIIPFALNTWYHNKAIYDPTSDMFTLEITRKDDGVLLGTYTLAAVGEFLNIERLGISCTQSTYGDRLQAGCIDNVVLYVVPEPQPPPVYHVDAVNGNDNNNGLSRRTAFATISKGIDSATNRYKVLVYPGVYQEEVDFKGKAITVQGVATKVGIPVIENPGDFAVSFYNGEGPRSILKNFVVRNSFMAVFIAGSSPTLKNLNIIGNKYGIEAYAGAEPKIANCIFYNNSDSDIFGCEARYSCTSEPGQGNIAADPCFVDLNNGDYHLLSQRGRYWPRADVWVLDRVTSPCIDGGDPDDDVLDEPMPNGGRIDMGAFGGTPFASMSDIKWLDGDINHDGRVNLVDLAMLAGNWLQTELAPELPGNYNWFAYNGHHYALTPDVVTWAEAEAEAVAVGGHLVTINSAEEQNWLVSKFLQVPEPTWIGLYQDHGHPDYSEPAGGWVWISGEPVTYTNWHRLLSIEPNNDGGGEDYAVMGWGWDCSWNDWGPPGSNSNNRVHGIIELPW